MRWPVYWPSTHVDSLDFFKRKKLCATLTCLSKKWVSFSFLGRRSKSNCCRLHWALDIFHGLALISVGSHSETGSYFHVVQIILADGYSSWEEESKGIQLRSTGILARNGFHGVNFLVLTHWFTKMHIKNASNEKLNGQNYRRSNCWKLWG